MRVAKFRRQFVACGILVWLQTREDIVRMRRQAPLCLLGPTWGGDGTTTPARNRNQEPDDSAGESPRRVDAGHARQ